MNVLSASLIFIKQRNFPKLEQYYQEALQMLDTSFTYDDLRLHDLQNIGSIALKGLMAYRVMSAYQAQIPIHFECIDPINLNDRMSMQIVGIVEILLDQAFEAVQEDHKELQILIITQDQYVIIEIKYVIKTLDSPFYTIMHRKSEYENYSLQELLAQVDDCELVNTIQGNMITHELIIRNK